MRRHKAGVHGVGSITWHACDASVSCEYKSQYKSALKRHKADIHAEGVSWFECGERSENGSVCVYKAKRNADVLKHKRNVHKLEV